MQTHKKFKTFLLSLKTSEKIGEDRSLQDHVVTSHGHVIPLEGGINLMTIQTNKTTHQHLEENKIAHKMSM